MQRYAFKMKLKPDAVAEYKKRHEEIWPELQKELRSFFTALLGLIDRLPRIEPGADYPAEVKRQLSEINRFLATCAEYPQLSIASHLFRRYVDGIKIEYPPHLVQEFVPVRSDGDRRSAASAICALTRYGLLDRIRQCLRCEKWFFAVKSDSKYCSRSCQTRPTEQYRATKREYAKRRYWEERKRDERATIKARGVRK